MVNFAAMLLHVLGSWLILSVAVWLTAVLLPGVKVKGVGGAIVTAALFGVLNFFLGWVLFVLIGLGTLGVGFILAFVTRWIVDAIILKITDALTDKLTVRGFGTALVAALIMALLGGVGEYLLHLAA